MVKGGALALRAGLVIAATVGLAVLLTAVLAYLKFERKLLDVTTSRVSVIADDLRRRAEYGLTLGLDLAELEDLQTIVLRIAGTLPGGSIDIVGENGIVLFASSADRVGQRPAPTSTEHATGTSQPIRYGSIGDTLAVVSEIRNSFGQIVGSVVLRASLSALQEETAAVRADLSRIMLALVGTAAAITLAAVFATIRVTLGGSGDGDDLEGASADALHRTVEPRIAAACGSALLEIEAVERLLDDPHAGVQGA